MWSTLIQLFKLYLSDILETKMNIHMKFEWITLEYAAKPRDGRYKNGRIPTKNKAENKESEKHDW